MDRINEGIYTTGNSFRSISEARARSYSSSELQLPIFDKYGHILTEDAGKRGMNFLPSLRDEIISAVIEESVREKASTFLELPRICSHHRQCVSISLFP